MQEFNEGQNKGLETMMENLKLEREQSRQEMTELVNAIANMPPPVGKLIPCIEIRVVKYCN